MTQLPFNFEPAMRVVTFDPDNPILDEHGVCEPPIYRPGTVKGFRFRGKVIVADVLMDDGREFSVCPAYLEPEDAA